MLPLPSVEDIIYLDSLVISVVCYPGTGELCFAAYVFFLVTRDGDASCCVDRNVVCPWGGVRIYTGEPSSCSLLCVR